MVSHAQNKTLRRFFPNLNRATLLSEGLGLRLHLKISAAALRDVEHAGGVDAFLLKARDRQLSKRALHYKRLLIKKGFSPQISKDDADKKSKVQARKARAQKQSAKKRAKKVAKTAA